MHNCHRQLLGRKETPFEIINHTAFSFGFLAGQIRPPQYTLTFIVKGTFQLIKDDSAVAVPDAQQPLSGDTYSGEDLKSSIYYESDFALYKPRTDLLLVGQCHTPDERPMQACPVTFTVGNQSRTLWVFGNRYWKRSLVGFWSMTEPEPFSHMPLAYENSFGGEGYVKNPVGKGYIQEIKKHGADGWALPNIEDTHALVKNPHSKIDVAGFGPLARSWQQRTAKMGTRNKKWLSRRQAGLPKDFDWAFYNAAPELMQIQGYLRGDEALGFDNLHRRHAKFRSRLPGQRVRCFMTEATETYSLLREVSMNLDTLWVDMESETLVLVWRGVAVVKSEEYPEVNSVAIFAEDLRQPPKALDKYQHLLNPGPMPVAGADEPFKFSVADQFRSDAQLQKAIQEMERALKQSGIDLETLDRHANSGKPFTPVPDELLRGFGFSASELTRTADRKAEFLAEQEALLKQMGLDDETLESLNQITPPAAPLDRAAVQQRLQAGQSLAGADLSNIDLAEMDLHGVDLHGADLGRANLKGVILELADLTGANLTGANLSRANLKGAHLGDADLTRANLQDCDLSGAHLEGALLEQATLARANLSQCIAPGALFARADLSATRLDTADLTSADFTGALLENTIMVGAVLAHACINNTQGANMEMTGADLSHLSAAGGCVLRGARLKGVAADGSNWTTADLTGADFSSAELVDADFYETNLTGTNFNLANLNGAQLTKANLTAASLMRSNLFQVNLVKADLSTADLRGANLYGADLTNAVLNQTKMERANIKMALMESSA